MPNEKIKCPNCNWQWVRYRLKSDTWICTHCGCQFKMTNGKPVVIKNKAEGK